MSEREKYLSHEISEEIDDLSIDELITYFTQVKETNKDYKHLSLDIDWSEYNVYLQGVRPETDLEKEERRQNALSTDNAHEQQERQLLKELKEKYEK